MVGGWGLLSSWQRNFDFMQFLKKITDSNTIIFFASLGNIWHPTHRSNKCEFDNILHEDDNLPDADLRDYPSPAEAARRWHQGMSRAARDLTRLGVHHADIPDIAWSRPWLYDPPNPDPDLDPFDEYLVRKHAPNDSDDDSDYDPDDDPDDDSDSESSVDNSSDGDDCSASSTDSESSDDSDSDGDNTRQQLDGAIARLHDSVLHDTPRRMIHTPSGKLISKSTAVSMLTDMFGTSKELSKDRLRRIEQCAGSSHAINEQLVEHDGVNLELFQDVAMAFDDGPRTPIRVEFGRIQKIVNRTNKRTHLRLSSVPLDNVPISLEVAALQILRACGG